MLPSLLYHCLALFHGRKVDYTVRPAPLILSKVAKTEPKNVPMHFDWRNVNGKSFVVADVNQHIPTYCGSCWIHGTIAALNDRIKVARGAAYPDVMLSRQAALNCIRSRSAPDEPPQGCNGGDPWDIHEHLSHSPLPDETCQPYEAKNGVCDTSGVCRNCLPQALVADPAIPPTKWSTPGCFSVEPAATYGVSEYGGVAGEHAMQQEILARGPIVCGVAADMTFLLEYEQHLIEGVYVDESYFPMGGAPSAHNASEVDHDVEVTGWGVTPGGIPYWVVRNSWGTYWGEHGWFKLLRGSNHLFIEADCAWAVPDVKALDRSLHGHLVGDYMRGGHATPSDEDSGVLKRIKQQRGAMSSASSSLMAADAPAAAAPVVLTQQASPEGATSSIAVSSIVALAALATLTAAAVVLRARGAGAVVRRWYCAISAGGDGRANPLLEPATDYRHA